MLQISLLIAINITASTIVVKKLKETATPIFQTLTDTASTQLHTLTDTASVKLQDLKQKAATTIKQLQENAKTNLNEFVESIDYDKLKKLDFLNIVPKVHHKLAHKLPSHAEKLKFILKSVKGVKSLKGKDFLLSFDGEYPWPVVKRRIEYIYE